MKIVLAWPAQGKKWFVMAILLAYGCKKEKDTGQYFTVLEYKTNKPIDSARFQIYQCKSGGWGGPSCNSTSENYYSDFLGRIRLELETEEHFAVFKSGYYALGNIFNVFRGDIRLLDTLYLNPVGKLQMNFKTSKTIPANTKAVVTIKPENMQAISHQHPFYPYYLKAGEFIVKDNYSLNLPAFGRQINQIRIVINGYPLYDTIYRTIDLAGLEDTINVDY